MLLLIDAGNTRVKWARAECKAQPGQWLDHGWVERAQVRELRAMISAHACTRALVSNVAGKALREDLEQLLLAGGLAASAIEWFVSEAERAGLKNGYRNPSQLGCDRFASAIGARTLHPGRALLVATCGTATTIDAVSAEGVFVGGMILPGLGLMATSLARNTAQLPQIAHDLNVADPFADNTDAAIASGCLSAQAGAITRAHDALRRRTGETPLCLLSGGAAALISPHLALPHVKVDNLVLIGLHAAHVLSSQC